MAEKSHETPLWLRLFKPGGWTASGLLFIVIGAVLGLSYTGYMDMLEAKLDAPPFSFMIGDYQLTAYKLLKGLLIVAVLFWGTATIAGFGEAHINRLTRIRASNRILLTKLFQIALYVAAFLIALDVMGIELTALAVFGGALGIGIGFGLQKITSNFISGMILLFEKSIEQDDLVELSDGTYGFIRKTSARFTLVETFDGREIMIPNEDFITNRVVNWTYSNKSGRVEITLGVSYGSDLEKAYELIVEAAREHPRCSSAYDVQCFLTDFADSSVNF
ncbi:MAG: mechanosensitive ion channel family protein, partial [Rickettsiales bacterium]